MGFRYRKSINLGGGFRINISKSGIGYSYGVKGFRKTKTARGTTRTTYSIPGTGLSYVQEEGRKKNPSHNSGQYPDRKNIPSEDSNHYDMREIANASAENMTSDGLEHIIASARKAIKRRSFVVFGLVVSLIAGCILPYIFILSAILIVLLIIVSNKSRVYLEYEIDEDQQSSVERIIRPNINITKCAKLWRVTQSSRVVNTKYSSGASCSVKRVSCKANTKTPFPFKTNAETASFKTNKETLLFLPDKLFIIQGSKIGALSYEDISFKKLTTRFVEDGILPKDAQVVDYTWKFVNKSGGPDRRFKNNFRIPVCLYGEMNLYSPKGLDTVIMYSNPDVDK